MGTRDGRSRIVGIAGPSAGAKTTFAKLLQAALDDGSSVYICHDDYYRDLSALPIEERAKQNFDHPDALETELLIAHLDGLKLGQSIEKPLYDFARHTRSVRTETLAPADVVIVEGILVLAIPPLREAFDLKVYVDTPADICLARRILRDTAERGRTVDSVVRQYLDSVRPMHQEFVLPSKQFADVVVVDGELEEGADVVLARLADS